MRDLLLDTRKIVLFIIYHEEDEATENRQKIIFLNISKITYAQQIVNLMTYKYTFTCLQIWIPRIFLC